LVFAKVRGSPKFYGPIHKPFRVKKKKENKKANNGQRCSAAVMHS
jgi:hypothetical protein